MNEKETMANSQDDFEIVEMKDLPSPEPAPAPAPTTTKQQGTPSKTYEELMEEYKNGVGTTTFEVAGIHYFLYNNGMEDHRNEIKQKMMSHGQCRICARRSYKFCPLVGPYGPAFLSNIMYKNDGCEHGILHSIKNTIREKNELPYEPDEENASKMKYGIYVINDLSFPSINEGMDPKTGETYQHVTVKPKNVTPLITSNKYKRFLEENISVAQNRLSNLFNTEAIKSIKMIIENIQQLERPNHWIGVIKWYKKILVHLDGRVYETLSDQDKVHLGVFAMMNGSHDIDENTVVNKTFRQSSNFVDFSTMDTLEDIFREMDTRSAPQNYMQSALVRNLEKHRVTSKWRISLIWDGKAHRDDLDIQVLWYIPNGPVHRVYYGNRVIQVNGYETRLDFDMNAGTKVDEPAENISCVPYGEYRIQVNNFTRYTEDMDIPFKVIIHQEGQEDIVIERVWPVDRPPGNFMDIKTHRFTQVQNQDLVMSTKAGSRAMAHQGEWDEYFGPNITSVVPNVEDLGSDTPVNVWKKGNKKNVGNSSFMEMASSSVHNKKVQKAVKKKYLSQKDDTPKNLSDLLVYMSTGRHSLKIKPRGKSPGYITKIVTLKDVQKTPYSLNHFHTKCEVPRKPEVERFSGTARFDNSWFHSGRCPEYSEVNCVVQFGTKWFLVVEGVKLPNDPNYPLTGGFHTGSLKPSFHSKHNYQWTYNNTRIFPTVSYSDSSIPLIGTFLIADEVEVFLDGRPIIIKTN